MRSDVEHPSENKRDRKTDQQQRDHNPDDRVRNVENRKDLSKSLRERPTHNDVRDRDSINFSPLQFFEEAAHNEVRYCTIAQNLGSAMQVSMQTSTTGSRGAAHAFKLPVCSVQRPFSILRKSVLPVDRVPLDQCLEPRIFTQRVPNRIEFEHWDSETAWNSE